MTRLLGQSYLGSFWLTRSSQNSLGPFTAPLHLPVPSNSRPEERLLSLDLGEPRLSLIIVTKSHIVVLGNTDCLAWQCLQWQEMPCGGSACILHAQAWCVVHSRWEPPGILAAHCFYGLLRAGAGELAPTTSFHP